MEVGKEFPFDSFFDDSSLPKFAVPLSYLSMIVSGSDSGLSGISPPYNRKIRNRSDAFWCRKAQGYESLFCCPHHISELRNIHSSVPFSQSYCRYRNSPAHPCAWSIPAPGLSALAKLPTCPCRHDITSSLDTLQGICTRLSQSC